MPGDMLGQSIAYGLLKLLQYVSGYRGQLILQLCTIYQILTNHAVNHTAIPFESRPSNYGTANFIKAKEILSRTSSSTDGNPQ